MVSGFLSLVRNDKSVKDSFGAKESFPLQTVTWVRKNSLHLPNCIVSGRKDSFTMRTARDTRQALNFACFAGSNCLENLVNSFL